MPEPAPAPLRRYSYTLTKDDYDALLKRIDNRPVSLSLIAAIAILAGLGWSAFQPDISGELALLPVIAATAAVLYACAHLWRRVRRAQRLARWTPPAAPVEIEAFADRLIVNDNGSARIFAWDELAAVSSDESRVYLTKSRDDAVIIPLRAFGSSKDMRDFALLCDGLMRNAGDASAQTSDSAPAATPAPAFALPSTGTGQSMGVDVTLTQDDARHVEEALRRTGADAPVRLSVAALTMGLAGAAIFGPPVWLVATGAPEIRLLAGAIAALAGSILLTFLGARRIESARAAPWPADDPRRSPRRFEIDEAGLVSRGAEFETRVAWAGVASIRETEQHVLFITRWKEIYAVPIRCFSTTDEGRAFANKARAYKAAS